MPFCFVLNHLFSMWYLGRNTNLNILNYFPSLLFDLWTFNYRKLHIPSLFTSYVRWWPSFAGFKPRCSGTQWWGCCLLNLFHRKLYTWLIANHFITMNWTNLLCMVKYHTLQQLHRYYKLIITKWFFHYLKENIITF